MHHLLSTLLLCLSLTLTAQACAWYTDCKCHSDSDNVANDTVTELACGIYDWGSGYYLGGEPYVHQCHKGIPDYGIANCGWDKACQRYGAYHQHCWNKFGHASSGDGSDLPPVGWDGSGTTA